MQTGPITFESRPVRARPVRAADAGDRQTVHHPWLCCLPWIYAILLVGTRLLSSQSLEHDEAEQVLFAQRLEWGYSLQPPLYTWITWLSFQLFGLNLFAIAAVKAGLLFTLFVLMGRLLRRLGVPHDAAAAAGMTLLFCHFFAWNVSLNITHTLLSATLYAAVLLQAVRLLEHRSAARYAVLGLLAGLGVLAKYNFAVFATALLLGALTLPAARRTLLDRRIAIAVAAGMVVVAPHLGWLTAHWDGVFAALEVKTGLDDAALTVSRVGSSLWVLFEHALTLLLPMAAGLGFCLGWNSLNLFGGNADSQALRLFQRTAVALALLMAVLVTLAINRMTAGWLAPGLLLVPLVVFGRRAALEWPDRLSARLGWTLALVMATTTAVRIGFYGAWHGRNLGRDLVFAEAARELERSGLARGALLADNLVTAGNLRFQCPGLTVASLDMPLFQSAQANTSGVFIWNNSKKVVRTVRTHLAQFGIVATVPHSHVHGIILEREDLHPSFRSLALCTRPSSLERATSR